VVRMIKTVTVCDECSSERRDAQNHWWVVSTKGERPVFMCWPWDSGQNVVEAKHYCGHECAGKAFARWMHEQVNNGN
jgi:hypothetical protein